MILGSIYEKPHVFCSLLKNLNDSEKYLLYKKPHVFCSLFKNLNDSKKLLEKFPYFVLS